MQITLDLPVTVTAGQFFQLHREMKMCHHTARHHCLAVTIAVINMAPKNKLPDQNDIQLQQIANCVIDAYLNRNQRYTPKFGEHTQAIIHLDRPEGDSGPTNLQVGYWYEKADYEPENQK